jgi:histidyl-tRNA synthetase
VAKLFNFKMMEPAPIENLSILRAKSGSDVDKEIYAFKDKGGRDVGLRFDLTVGMTRYVCSRRDLKPPVKLASLAGAWRYDEPQHARYRWFRQWDLEVFGPPTPEADAEVIEATSLLFERLGFDDFRINIGDRSIVQSFVNDVLGIEDAARASELMRALDKTKKKSLSELRSEYTQKGFSSDQVDRLFEFGKVSGPPHRALPLLGQHGVDTSLLAQLTDSLRHRGVARVHVDIGVVRGIDYYTGVVFEVMDGAHPDLGSLAGGGRYDLLPLAFGRPDLSATGAAGGMERIALSLRGKPTPSQPLVYVASAKTELRPYANQVLGALRKGGVSAEGALLPRALSKQLEDASQNGADWAIIVGGKELASKKVTLRDMRNRSEELLTLEDALKRVKHA